jgi:hypothetical protein
MVGTGTGEPLARGSRIGTMRDVAHEVWGRDAIAQLAPRLDAETRAAFEDPASLPEWVPAQLQIAWVTALFDVVCGGREDDESYRRWIDEVTLRGFGQMGELFTSLGSPALVLRRSNDLWHFENSTGKLTYAPVTPTSGRITLRDHPFALGTPMQVAMTEAFRYVLLMCGVAWAAATYEVGRDGALHVNVAWGE